MTNDKRESWAMSWRTNAAVKPLLRDARGKKLTHTQKLILIILSDYISDEKGSAWCSIQRLADECLMSGRTLQRHLRKLEKNGLLIITYRKNQSSLYNLTPYVYTMVGGDNLSPGGDNKVSPGGDSVVSPELELKERIKNRVKALAVTYQETFSKPVWTLTPERLKKGVTRFEEFMVKAKGDIEKADMLMRFALKGLRASEFHMGQNDRDKRFVEWESHLFRSQEQTEKWTEQGLALAQKQRRVAATSGNVEGGIAEIKARRAANGY
jgi:predicted transcriptional regulator